MNEIAPATAKRRDDAARAAWLYFMNGRTQDEIAAQLNISRQAAQRLVAFAVSEKLIRFRLGHPIATCMELADRLQDRYGLEFCDIAPTDAQAPDSLSGIASATAIRLERLLGAKTPITVCVGTGRSMRAAVEEMDHLDRPQHRIVSLVGNMASDGRASPYDVVMRLADKLGAERFPLPVPVLTETVEDRLTLQSQRFFAALSDLRAQAKANFIGISEIGPDCSMYRDGFMSRDDVAALVERGAIGEITGWSFDRAGHLIEGSANDRVASLPLEVPPQRTTVVVGIGKVKVEPLRAALSGRLVSALITDERTGRALLQD